MHAVHVLSLKPLHLTLLYSTFGLQEEQFAQMVSFLGMHWVTMNWPLPRDSSAMHTVQGLHTLSWNLLHGETSYSVALQTLHCLHMDWMPNLELLGPTHLERSMNDEVEDDDDEEHCRLAFSELQEEHVPTSRVS